MDKETPEEKFAAWVEMWRKDIVHVGDVSHVLRSCIADSGRAAMFLAAPQEVRQSLLETFESVKASGEHRVSVPGSGLSWDSLPETLTAIRVLVDAGLLDASAAELATPAPFFIGLEHLQGDAALVDEFTRLASHEHELISAGVFSLSIPPFRYFGASEALLGMQLEINKREPEPDGRCYTLEPTERAIAHFEIIQPESDVISALAAASSHIRTIRLQPTRRRRRTGFDLSMDWREPAAEILCQGLRLTSLEAVPVPPPGKR